MTSVDPPRGPLEPARGSHLLRPTAGHVPRRPGGALGAVPADNSLRASVLRLLPVAGRLLVLAATLAMGGLAMGGPAAMAASASPCRTLTHEGAKHTVCEIDIRKHTVRLFWKTPDGQPYRRLSALPRTDPASQRPLLLAMNAGMFKADLSPVGLYLEDGRQHSGANTRKGGGNFHLLPNGVFYVDGGRAGVMETRAYLKKSPAASFATQSGPMLVIDGQLHPKFVRAEASRKMRNGVGVRDGQTVVLAISEDDVSFAAFGRLFKDVLKCRNALFLDGGSVPTLMSPALGRSSNFLSMGPMLAVYGP